jgi:hypothetical protein
MESDFIAIVRLHFAFLVPLGFSEVEASPEIVRYKNGTLDVMVHHSLLSFEVGLHIDRSGETFSISEVIRVADPVAAASYRCPTANTLEQLECGVHELSWLVRRFGERALLNDPEFFACLRGLRIVWSDAYALDVLVEHVRPRAETAFREGRYREAVELYEKIASRLTPAERAKLAAARKRS